MQMRLAWGLLVLAACTGIDSDPDGSETLAYLDQPGAIAVAGDDLYFVGAAQQDYELLHMAKHGGEVRRLDKRGVISAIAADASGVYWVVTDAGISSVMMYPRDGSAPVEVFVNPYGLTWGSTYRNVVVDGTYVYYADQGGRVWQVPTTGASATVLGTTDTSAGSVAVSPEGIWVSTLRGARRLPDGPVIELSADQAPNALAWADGMLFVAFSGSGDTDGVIVRVSLDAGAVEVANRLVLPGHLAAQDGYVYMTTGNDDSAIRRVPYAGGGSQPLATGRWPSGIALDDTYVYWSDWQNDRIRRVPR